MEASFVLPGYEIYITSDNRQKIDLNLYFVVRWLSLIMTFVLGNIPEYLLDTVILWIDDSNTYESANKPDQSNRKRPIPNPTFTSVLYDSYDRIHILWVKHNDS